MDFFGSNNELQRISDSSVCARTDIFRLLVESYIPLVGDAVGSFDDSNSSFLRHCGDYSSVSPTEIAICIKKSVNACKLEVSNHESANRIY